MKKHILPIGLMTLLLMACSVNEIDHADPSTDDQVFYASIESSPTKVFVDEKLNVLWNADDRVSIFNKNTYNQQYKFLGKTGDNAGAFNKAEEAEFVTGTPISNVVSVYPYSESTKISNDGILSVELPSTQKYVEESFGYGANTMVAVSSDNFLQYKNVGGYLRISLYGESVSVSSITLKGNNGEILAGKASVTMPLDGTPTVTLANDATDEITLVCDTPVSLGSTVEKSTDFWFVVPPTTFSKGFSISVNGNDGVFEKITEKTLTLERNKLLKMSPVEVSVSQLNNVIYYTSSDGNIVTPNENSYCGYFGATIISNEYSDGLGVIKFDGDVTTIGRMAFYECVTLVSLSIPSSVTSIEEYAFSDCTGLTSITIPEGVKGIGRSSFHGCTNLTSITIPSGVEFIGESSFYDCSSLISVTIPDGVTTIKGHTFSLCSSLKSVSIPESVTSIEEYAFNGCSSLSSIAIPSGVTSIGTGAFDCCSGLTSIAIPSGVTVFAVEVFRNCTGLTSIPVGKNVTKIGDGAFCGCTGFTSITIPDSITNIGNYAFDHCTNLTSITIPESVESIGNEAFLGCISLSSISIPKSVTLISDGLFSGCTGLKSVSIPDCVTSIGMDAFYSCTGLDSISIPSSVTSIGFGTLQGCSNLNSITVQADVPPALGDFAFDDTNNCPIYVPAKYVDTYKTTEYMWKSYADRIQAIPSSSVSIPEAVDLGLPSGIKWASFNLGASKPEEYGDYYAWGETEPYYSRLDPLTWKEGKENGYIWESYKWCQGTSNTLSKYCTDSSYGYNGFMDGKTTLDLEDDAAHVALGGKWRMPTAEEWTELRDLCTWVWTSINGTDGYEVTGPNRNSVFLSAAGYRALDEYRYPGLDGRYWSSSLYEDRYSSAAWRVVFSSGVGGGALGDNNRCYGLSVRPVCD